VAKPGLDPLPLHVWEFHHHRELMAIVKQTMVRANRDRLYSSGVFDRAPRPVTITGPKRAR
jgi:hypothetical protein